MFKKTVTAVAVFALGTTLAFAGPHGGGKGRHGKDGFVFSGKLAQKLNLTDAQKQQIRALEQQFRDQNKAFFDSARATRKEVRAAKEANDTARLESLKPTIEAQHAQMKQLREAQRERILSVLTPDQRAQLETMKADRKSRRGNRS
jgi:Spy/CpxP family protein refolding chaperone